MEQEDRSLKLNPAGDGNPGGGGQKGSPLPPRTLLGPGEHLECSVLPRRLRRKRPPANRTQRGLNDKCLPGMASRACDVENHLASPGVFSLPGKDSSSGHCRPTPTPQLGGRQNDTMQGLAQVPGDPPAPVPGPAGSGSGTVGPKRRPASGGPGLSILAGTSPNPRPARRSYGEEE